jgi:hypothetical protein
MIIEMIIGLVLLGGSVGVYIRDSKETKELRDQVKLLNLKIEGQIKPQVERHHTALLTIDENMRRLVDALK